MRATIILRWLLLGLLVAAPAARAQPAAELEALTAFAETLGLRDVTGFIDTVQSLRGTGHLPPRYLTKGQARTHGWHGGGLCAALPGHAIGGDAFDNSAGVLPGPAHSYREADLDEVCDSRGPKRLIFSEDGAIYLSPDHYRHFVPVP
jgi:ribonuclease